MANQTHTWWYNMGPLTRGGPQVESNPEPGSVNSMLTIY